MASKQFLRRLPLLSREGGLLNQFTPGALPDVANDVLPIVVASSDSTPNARSPPSALPVANSSGQMQRPGTLPHTLGRWSQRLSHLQPLQKPLSTLGYSPAAEATRPTWPARVEAAKGPTSIAAATLPAIAGILKQKRPAAVRAITFEPDASTSAEPKEAAASAASGAAAKRATTAAATAAAPAPTPAAITAPERTTATAAGASTTASSTVLAPSSPVLPLPEPPSQQPQLLHSQQPQQPQNQRRGSLPRGVNPAGNSSIQLNKHIMACRTTEELLTLVQQRGSQFDYFNISTALARVPKLAATSAGGGGGGGASQQPSSGSNNPQQLMSQQHQQPQPHQQLHQVAAGIASSAAAAASLPSDLHVDAAGRALLEGLAQLMLAQIDSFDARGLANSAWAFGKLKYVPSGGLPAVIAQAALKRMHEFSPQNLSNLIWSFVYMHHADEELLAAASQFVRARVGEFKPQELANIVWAFASLGHRNRDEEMLNAVAEQAKRIAPLFKEQELSNVLWALGKMNLRGRPDVFEALMAETRAKLPAFLPQGISNVAWALASVGHVDVSFLDRVVAQCGQQLGGFDVQALANMVWAMASLGYYQPGFVTAVVNECLSRGLDRLSPQNLSNILWGCATLNHRDPRMLSAWAAQTLEKLPSFEPQGLSNTAWAFARLGFHNPQLFQALGTAALHKLDGFTAQGLSNLAWAMASAGHAQPQLFEALASRSTALAAGFNAQNCSVTLWSSATLRHYDEKLFSAMLERLVAEVDTCEPQNVANALWAVARMGHPLSADSAGALVRHAVRLLPRMSQQELCNTMWAVASLELMSEGLFVAFCDCLQRLTDITPEGIHQAYHAQLMFHSSLARAAGVSLAQLQDAAVANPEASFALLPRLPEPLHSLAASMWAESARDVHVSRFHQEVSGALAVAGVPHALEWVTDDKNFSVDIGLQVNSQPTAVEVNGSHHYSSNPPHRALGDVGVRRRLLEDRGWHVVDVGFKDWEGMGGSLAERGSNLVGRIAASLDEWDWRYVGLPQRDADASAPPPKAVVGPAAQPPPPVTSQQLPTAANEPALSSQPPIFAPHTLQHALSSAMGLAPLFPTAPLSAARLGNSAAGGGLNNAGWSSLDGLMSLGSSDADMLDHLGHVDEQAVQAAVDAAEALGALPGGNLLLAQQMYDVLGVRLPPAVELAAARAG
ncbi:hypothetical protein Agub_g6492, partial [Astrephomene gubernaculifera]